jgi:hypothetical protein
MGAIHLLRADDGRDKEGIYTECTEITEDTETRVGWDRGARRTARGETEETQMHKEW